MERMHDYEIQVRYLSGRTEVGYSSLRSVQFERFHEEMKDRGVAFMFASKIRKGNIVVDEIGDESGDEGDVIGINCAQVEQFKIIDVL